ncbi:MAG TPA: hypothetical protein PLM74_06780 [Bacillota bacterium]|nr:hypothetical protein [Bacillota bacterium]
MAEYHPRSAHRIWTLAIIILVSSTLVGCGSGTSVPTYSISGRVTRASDHTGLDGIILQFSGGFGTTTTSNGGYWNKTGVKGIVTVTPVGQGWTFAPPNREVSGAASDVDFEAMPIGPYSVSGRVADQGGAGIADVLLFLGGGFGTARTASDGCWSATGLSGDVTVTPAKAGLVFTPETVTVSGWSSSIHFTGSPATNTYSVSGRVTNSSDGSGLYGVLFTFSGGFGRAQGDASGYWSKSGLYGTVTVTPSRPGWEFQPQSCTVTSASNAADFVGWRPGSSAAKGGDK